MYVYIPVYVYMYMYRCIHVNECVSVYLKGGNYILVAENMKN
jgi:hypothetical protein